jgi:hypothetical protein
MQAFETVKRVIRKVTGVAEDKPYRKRTVIGRDNFELRGEVRECYWCHEQRPLKIRLVGLDLCEACAPPIEKQEVRRKTLWGGEDVAYYRPSQENMRLWIERRKQMFIQGWTGSGAPPKLED